MNGVALCSQKRTTVQPFVRFNTIQEHLFHFFTVQIRYSELHIHVDGRLSVGKQYLIMKTHYKLYI